MSGRPALHGLYLNRIAGGARDHVAVYVWREFRQERVFVANHEIAELGWFSVDALPEDGKRAQRGGYSRLSAGGRRIVCGDDID